MPPSNIHTKKFGLQSKLLLKISKTLDYNPNYEHNIKGTFYKYSFWIQR